MEAKIGIRREDKSKWERRVPLIPEHIQYLNENYNIETIIQPSQIRVYTDDEYRDAGATVQEDLSSCPIVFAVKEIPKQLFQQKTTYAFFSHTIKGQSFNMPMLQQMIDLNCTLIDYEVIKNEKGVRLVFFGRFAGIAGMVDALWAFGQRMKKQGISSPLSDIRQTVNYSHHLPEIKEHLKHISEQIKHHGLPQEMMPIVVGFAGYGNVSKGAQEILDILPVKEVSPQELLALDTDGTHTCLYKVVFKEKDLVRPLSTDISFELQDYYQHPEKYESDFEQYLPHLSILMNCIYWNRQYPRLVTKQYLKQVSFPIKLQVIGDISIDINGAIECTEKATQPDNPVYVYNPTTNQITDGYTGEGVVILGVDNLPCELPRESSREFSTSIYRFIPDLLKADFSQDFSSLVLPSELKRAVILYHGDFTPSYTYINKFL